MKSGYATGRPPVARDLTLSGTGAHQAAESYTSMSGTRPARINCTVRHWST